MGHFKIDVDVTLNLSVDFASRLTELILESGTEDKQMRAFAHSLDRAMDGEKEKQKNDSSSD